MIYQYSDGSQIVTASVMDDPWVVAMQELGRAGRIIWRDITHAERSRPEQKKRGELNMTKDEFLKPFENDEIAGSKLVDGSLDGCCNALAGLNIIAKYLPKEGIHGAGWDEIYSAYIDELIKAGVTTDDAEELSRLNWHIKDGECLACYV